TNVLLLKCNVAGSVASAARAVARVIPYSHENIRPVCVVAWFVISAANAISFSLTLNGKGQACITAGNHYLQQKSPNAFTQGLDLMCRILVGADGIEPPTYAL